MSKVLVIGSGGRCHSIIHKLSQCDNVTKIYAAPGNYGISLLAENVNINVTDVDALIGFALDKQIDLTIVGPEASLAKGIVNEFKKHNLKIFGPTKEAALIESSKEFAKDLMKKYDIPTAKYEVFDDYEKALSYCDLYGYPIVIKYDGLAQGKGVVIVNNHKEASATLETMLKDKIYGDSKVVIEEFLDGIEFSYMCLCNGTNVYPLLPSQDHKRAYDNDLGPNTGGMGAYTGLSFLTKEDLDYSLNEIMIKTCKALKSENREFCGILYGGLIKTKNGIKVIEFNARFGDPETEVVLYSLQSNIYNLFCDILNERKVDIKFDNLPCVGVVLAHKNYPNNVEKGAIINFDNISNGYIYHMGTKEVNGNITINGGRVLMCVANGNTLQEAKDNAYKIVKAIHCDSLYYRTDIADKSLKR